MDSSHLQFLISTFKHVEEFKVDWDGVMKENGLSRRDNTVTKFRVIMKKYGINFTNGKFTTAENTSNTDTAQMPTTPQIKTSRKRKSDSTNDRALDSSHASSSSKKRKLKMEKETKTVPVRPVVESHLPTEAHDSEDNAEHERKMGEMS